jgi:lipopolysaccharide export system permease protein
VNTARRYLASEIYRSSAVVLLALVGLFTFFALVDDLDQVGRGGYTIYSLFLIEALALPTRTYDILPIGLLIGCILALAGLAQRQELVIFRVSGVSGMRLLRMLWVVALPVVVVALLLAELITPIAELKLNEAKLAYTGSAGSSSGMLRSGYWFKESTADGERIINVASLQVGGSGRGITIYEFNKTRQLASVMQAASATFGHGELTLSQATVNAISPDAETSLDAGKRATKPPVTVTTQPTLSVPSTLTPELLFARVLTPERMSFIDLFDYVGYLSKNQLVSQRQMVAIWRKLAYPFTLLAMVTLAAPLGFMQTRRGGVGVKVFMGILLGVGFFMLNQLSLNMGMLNRWPPWITAVGPNVLALVVGLASMLVMEYSNKLPTRWRHFGRRA